MDPIFEHPVFDSAMEKVKPVIRHFEKPQEKFENSLYTFFKCGSNNVFSIAKQVRSADEEHLHSTNAVIVIINGEMDDTDHAANIQSHQSYQLSPAGDTNHIYHIGCFRI